jgi:hypothetical protein
MDRPADCEWEHPHPSHPCGWKIVPGVTTCHYCGNLDGSPECEAAGCWQPVTQADVDALVCEALESSLEIDGK